MHERKQRGEEMGGIFSKKKTPSGTMSLNCGSSGKSVKGKRRVT